MGNFTTVSNNVGVVTKDRQIGKYAGIRQIKRAAAVFLEIINLPSVHTGRIARSRAYSARAR